VLLRRRSGYSLAAAVLTLALVACGASAQGTGSTVAGGASHAGEATGSAAAVQSAPAAACGAAAAQTVADAAGSVAKRIYGREVASPEVSRDRHQVESYGPLLSALAGGSGSAVSEAVNSLVFSHTHVVRLRVSRGGVVLADVGGPYILAPSGGDLHSQGRTVGHYLLSVQDDSGYAKLETRYIGVPLIIRQGSRRLPVEGTTSTGSASIPDRGPVSFHGASYHVFTFTAGAFPSGSIRISMLIPTAARSSASCTLLRVNELNRIAQLIWRRFQLVGAPVSGYVSTIGSNVGALSYVRAGSRQISGSTSPGPARLPLAGTVSYHGVPYRVASFAAHTGGVAVRVYQLVP
jgi:hypothetical protein